MASNPSIADRFVEVVEQVRRLDADLELTHAERHAVRSCKQAAEAALLAGIDGAWKAVFVCEAVRHFATEFRAQAAAGVQGEKP